MMYLLIALAAWPVLTTCFFVYGDFDYDDGFEVVGALFFGFIAAILWPFSILAGGVALISRYMARRIDEAQR